MLKKNSKIGPGDCHEENVCVDKAGAHALEEGGHILDVLLADADALKQLLRARAVGGVPRVVAVVAAVIAYLLIAQAAYFQCGLGGRVPAVERVELF